MFYLFEMFERNINFSTIFFKDIAFLMIRPFDNFFFLYTIQSSINNLISNGKYYEKENTLSVSSVRNVIS